MFVAIILAALVADASPTPSPAVSATPTVQCDGKCLLGIAIGADKYQILEKLGSHPAPDSDQNVRADFNGYPDGLMLAIYYQKAVVGVSISSIYGKALVYKDPYGVKLEDSTDHLQALRGKPDAVEGNAWRYGPVDGIHWLYTIKDGTVSEILLSSLPKLL
jgi:hypothetical protein